MSAQSIRPSQFIYTYGPGAILEGPEGPRVVRSIETSTLFKNETPLNYQIQEPTLSALLPGDAPQIFRLPTNAERREVDSAAIYMTSEFPRWALCVSHSLLYQHDIGSTRSGCPRCPPWKAAWQARAQWRREAIRFVLACPRGHLADVFWPAVVRHKGEGCAPQYLKWSGGGGALRNVQIVCPDCGGTGNLGTAWHREWNCSGSFPERGVNEACTDKAKMTQRGAANLHLPEIRRAVTIPRLDTPLHLCLSSSQVKPVLHLMAFSGGLSDGAVIRSKLAELADARLIPAGIMAEVARHGDPELARCCQEVLSTALPQSETEARLREFLELQRASTFGHPPEPPLYPGAVPDFEVRAHLVRRVALGPLTLRVTPVSRLRVVMAQIGYRRMSSTAPLVDCGYRKGSELWYPGVELRGEGLFLDLAPEERERESASNHPPMAGADAKNWSARWEASQRAQDHPVYVWWHTLSHRLIRSLSVDSGYSSASIAERVYVRVNEDGSAVGGVLLYAVQPGGDGTLGGLIALVPRFERVVDGALRNLDACSNDPLCEEARISDSRGNGAACYACGFVSETSCEARNLNLDRHLLLETLLDH